MAHNQSTSLANVLHRINHWVLYLMEWVTWSECNENSNAFSLSQSRAPLAPDDSQHYAYILRHQIKHFRFNFEINNAKNTHRVIISFLFYFFCCCCCCCVVATAATTVFFAYPNLCAMTHAIVKVLQNFKCQKKQQRQQHWALPIEMDEWMEENNKKKPFEKWSRNSFFYVRLVLCVCVWWRECVWSTLVQRVQHTFNSTIEKVKEHFAMYGM